MSEISTLDFLKFTAHSIGYTHEKKWHLEIPLLNLKVSCETPQLCVEKAEKEIKKLNDSLFADRLVLVKEELAEPIKPIQAIEPIEPAKQVKSEPKAKRK
jgi:ABC-type uncharacterized transport system auxiliary subunit